MKWICAKDRMPDKHTHWLDKTAPSFTVDDMREAFSHGHLSVSGSYEYFKSYFKSKFNIDL